MQGVVWNKWWFFISDQSLYNSFILLLQNFSNKTPPTQSRTLRNKWVCFYWRTLSLFSKQDKEEHHMVPEFDGILVFIVSLWMNDWISPCFMHSFPHRTLGCFACQGEKSVKASPPSFLHHARICARINTFNRKCLFWWKCAASSFHVHCGEIND